MDEEWMAMEESCKKEVSARNDPMPMEFLFVIRDKSERSKLIRQRPFFLTLHILSSLKDRFVSSDL